MNDKSRRDMVRESVLRSLPKGGVVAEIGVWEGNFSQKILEICEPAELNLIDPWLYQPEFGNTGFGRKKNKDRMEEIYEEVVQKFAGRPEVRIHRAKSEEAMAALPDGYLDWVYIDGNHNAPFIDQDLEISLRKVKPNGIISGDDYNWNDAAGAPVRSAVTRLMETLGDRASLEVKANQYVIRLARA